MAWNRSELKETSIKTLEKIQSLGINIRANQKSMWDKLELVNNEQEKPSNHILKNC